MALIKAALPATCDEVTAATGIPRSSTRKLVLALHAEHEVHVVGWRVPPSGGQPVATYAAGPGEDAKLVLRTQAERARDWRKSKPLAEPDTDGRRWLGPAARKRELASADATAKTRDPMIEAFFGPARRAA
jgi:hypothetical protein